MRTTHSFGDLAFVNIRSWSFPLIIYLGRALKAVDISVHLQKKKIYSFSLHKNDSMPSKNNDCFIISRHIVSRWLVSRVVKQKSYKVQGVEICKYAGKKNKMIY